MAYQAINGYHLPPLISRASLRLRERAEVGANAVALIPLLMQGDKLTKQTDPENVLGQAFPSTEAVVPHNGPLSSRHIGGRSVAVGRCVALGVGLWLSVE